MKNKFSAKKGKKLILLLVLLAFAWFFGENALPVNDTPNTPAEKPNTTQTENVPTDEPSNIYSDGVISFVANGHEFEVDFEGDIAPYCIINDNKPFFLAEGIAYEPYEAYSPLDELGRCGTASACLDVELMPTKKRESIGSIKPSGWGKNNNKYNWVDGKYVYNRCHLIGFQLAGENANRENLITGTRYLNVEGMLPFENMVADYIKETGNRVNYRVTPLFVGDNLVAHGVLIEAFSVEDDGEAICFNVFCPNVQPGVEIDYATGENHATN